MEILPSEYQHLDLQRSEKLFIRYAESSEEYGYLLLNTNAALIENEKQHIVICKEGVLLFKFFDTFNNATLFPPVMNAYFRGVFENTFKTVYEKMLMNKALVGTDGKLTIGYSCVCVFPNINRDDVDFTLIEKKVTPRIEGNCLFKEEFTRLKKNFTGVVQEYLDHNKDSLSASAMDISDSNVNSILQRLAPEYTTIRISQIDDAETYRGADNELLVVTPDDVAVKAFMLDKDQINIINKINKGDQLILACAGSGKSVLLISKCFKAARMNPEKKFLITCYSRQLQALYSWYIDRAGLRERNVECITFHKLCKKLANNNGFSLNGELDSWAGTVTDRYNNGYIKDRYYGIFIDEVQLFEQEWYKLCFNLLENKESGEHLFVICGDKTQEIKKKQKRGKAPWNAGENYPNYRGGNKSIRIEKNYRNCVEINKYINCYVSYAKGILNLLPGEDKMDPDMFLRGKAFRNGIGTFVKKLDEYTSKCEANIVIQTIHEAHDKYKIPYDEIAVVMYNKTYRKRMKGWNERYYNLERWLLIEMMEENMPHSMMYASDNNPQVRYGDNDGVAMISFDSVLGLDFRSVIVCGLKPFGDYDKTKLLDDYAIQNLSVDDDNLDNIRKNISMLYVACTRARDLLYIIQPEEKEDSLYMRLLLDAINEEEEV